jgi:TPR repeat
LKKATKKDDKGAIKEFNQALSLDNDQVDISVSRGLVRFRLGDKQGALSDDNRA